MTAQPLTAGGRTVAARHPIAILVVILLSYFMVLLDNSVIFTALPSLEADLGLGPGELSWVQDAYTLVFGGLLLLGARAGDLLGRRGVFVAGLAIFAAASLAIGLAPSGGWLIGARAVQGVGAAIVAPTSLALLTATFPAGRERARAVALYGATAGIGASLGMVVGGACAELLSWRAGFFLNVPIGVAMIVLAPRYLPETARATGRFDLVGALTATLGVGSLVFAIITAAEQGWTATPTLVAGAVGILLLVGFVVNESVAPQPILPLRLLRSRVRVGAYLARLLYMGAMIGFFFFTTQFLQDVLGFTPLQAGLGFLPMTVVNFAVALAVTRIVRAIGAGPPLVAGIVLTLVGVAWLSRVVPESDYLTAVAAPMLLIGAGQGLAFAPLTAAGIAGVAAADAGAASGLVNTFHQVGMSLGLGVLVVVAAGAHGTDAAASVAAEVAAALTAAAVLLALCAIVAAVLVLPPLVRERRAHPRKDTP